MKTLYGICVFEFQNVFIQLEELCPTRSQGVCLLPLPSFCYFIALKDGLSAAFSINCLQVNHCDYSSW